eukprot:366334-Chlamydomonas_euryale.AAC.9
MEEGRQRHWGLRRGESGRNTGNCEQTGRKSGHGRKTGNSEQTRSRQGSRVINLSIAQHLLKQSKGSFFSKGSRFGVKGEIRGKKVVVVVVVGALLQGPEGRMPPHLEERALPAVLPRVARLAQRAQRRCGRRARRVGVKSNVCVPRAAVTSRAQEADRADGGVAWAARVHDACRRSAASRRDLRTDER